MLQLALFFVQWVVLQAPKGSPKLGLDITMTTEAIPEIKKDGDFLVRNLEMSLDPYIRGTMNPVSYGRKQT